MSSSWQWDETLYAGSSEYYARGRVRYPREVAEAVREELSLDGTGRLLDVGCGPGALTLVLAPLFAEAVGVDADAQMLAEAEHRAVAAGSENVRWVHMRAEELPARLGSFQAVTFAQSFHWMERPRVATAVRSMLAPGGVWIHVNATTHRGIGAAPGDVPSPPHDEIEELVARFLGPVRRAGRAWLPDGTVEGEEEVMIAAGYSLRARLVVPSKIVDRTADDIVASVYSRSSSTPHLFGRPLGRVRAGAASASRTRRSGRALP